MKQKVFKQLILIMLAVQGQAGSIMPKKERIQKRKEKERQETAKSSKSLNAWLQPVTRSKTQERTDNSDAESVRPERAVEISKTTTER